ncbi:MAG TPA: endonuclease/exonuclease/phosphatase family protein [Phycisphaerae bacterium]|nr:endonuclease/exonuclease/phosphatase family protein [Phycisphaerae bacterium]HRW54915.1 endonuclease/exonuclease/phosphatase family protein [Phycisphaerae bacterium]
MMTAGASVHRDAAPVVNGSNSLSASADRTAPPTRTGPIRLLTYNILFARKWRESLAVIRDADADVICLQEVVPEDSLHESDCGIERIIDDIGMPCDFAWLWGKGQKRLGNATFARDGVTAREILKARPTPAYGLANRVDVAGAQLTIANIHLSPMWGPAPLMFLPSECFRRMEATHLSRWSRGATGPIVAAGDFNTFPHAPAYRRMASEWTDARSASTSRQPPTRPTYGLPFVIDHIFVRGAAEICDYTVIAGGGSDHRAVLATLKLPSENAFVTGESRV